MKVTRILGFTEEEITALTQAGKILGTLASVVGEETSDEIKLDDATAQLVAALKEVLARI